MSGTLERLTYPSGNTVTNLYDQAGRLASVSGNLGDGGSTRTYATGILYSPGGGLVKEQFGTTTPIYNKLFYNSRGQLAEIRASTSYTGPTDYDADRGTIINSYSSQCTGLCLGSSMPDNNGNLKQQDIQIPAAPTRSQYYEYDSLNRLLSAREVLNSTEQWKQQFSYDRWGNRTIDTGVTYGVGINNTRFEKLDAANQLYAPGDLALPMAQRRMQYDDAGNLTHDSYTGAGNRTYDAENKITSAWGSNNQAQLYSYDASGQRIKRTVYGTETWQVYGFGGELVAEYAANGSPASPRKEYGYRNGQLLITALPGAGRQNVALAANGGVASASSSFFSAPWNFTPAGANNGNRSGAGWGSGEGWNDNPPANTFPDWLQIDFNGSKIIDEIDVFTGQDNWQNPSEPTESTTFSLYGLTGYDVQYWNGSSWTTIPGGSVTANNKVWRKFTFTSITTTKIRVLTNASIDGYSRITEVEAWTAVATQRANFASASAGGMATASSSLFSSPWNFTPAGANNGNRSGAGWGSGEGWNDNPPPNTFPDWLQIDFNGSKTIDEIDVFTGQDNWQNPSEPTESMTFSVYGLTGYDVQYWNGSSWTTIPGGSVTANNKVWRKFTFSPITTTKIRVLTNASTDGYSRITELEVWGYQASSGTIQWLITDHLGTPRMILDQTGNLNTMKWHDYLPFGEELFAAMGDRTTAQGYTGGDGVRQQFTAQERDVETGLEYFIHRYYSSIQGRFTSPDAPFADQREADPQSWNVYTYVGNSPTNATDPFGLWKEVDCDNGGRCFEAEEGDTWETLYDETGFAGGFRPAEIALFRYFFQATPDIVPGETVVDVSGFLIWRNNLDGFERSRIGYDPRYMQYEFDFGVGGGLRNATKVAAKAGLFTRFLRWLGFGNKGAQFANGVTRTAIEAAAKDPGPTIQVFTKLTQTPAVGRELSVAVGEGAEALANAARPAGQVYTARIPKALIETLRTARLVQDSQTYMHGKTAVELHFQPEASEFIVKFFH